jgi:hypothetical protein
MIYRAGWPSTLYPEKKIGWFWIWIGPYVIGWGWGEDYAE